MGVLGTSLYADDLAADLRYEYRDLIGDGLSPAAAVERLMNEYATSLTDPDEEPVFWLALADTSWKLGRLEGRVRDNALRIIDGGHDLKRWDDEKDRKKREQVLVKLREQLLSPQPTPKPIPKTFKAANDWRIGEVVVFQLLSGRWVPLRVIGHHNERSGRFAICEALNWVGESIPSKDEIKGLPLRPVQRPWHTSQFLFPEPKTKQEQARIVRIGVVSKPSQDVGRLTIFIWKTIDQLMHDIFGFE